MNTSTFLTVVTFLLFFISNLKAQIPNSGFETWVVDPNNDNNPVGWETTNSDPYKSVYPYTPAYAGNFSMRVATFDPGFTAVNGFAIAQFPYNLRPTTFKACIKTTVMPGDRVYIIASLYKGDSIVAAPGSCTFVIDSNITSFQCYSFPITYLSSLIPDSGNIMIVAGASPPKLGTEIIVDQLSFGFTTGFDQPNKFINKINIYPNPGSERILISNETAPIIKIEMYDGLGHLIIENNLNNEKEGTVNVSDIPNGLYLVRSFTKAGVIISKFIKSN